MPQKVTADFLPQHWVHSHEEDTDKEQVFRPATFKFPPSRGRKAFELKPDGRLVSTGIGPTDRPQEAEGTWRLEEGNKLAFYETAQSAPKQVMQIASLDGDRLVIKRK